MSLFEIALSWYEQGLMCLPCYHGTKAFFRGCSPKRSKPDLAQLAKWFQSDRINIALVTGRDNQGRNLVILDFDNVPDFIRWREEYPIETRIDQTKRGFHIFLWTRQDEEWQGPAEVKAGGRTVLLPPSKVGKWEYRIFEDGEIAEVNLDTLGFAPTGQTRAQSKEKTPSLNISITGDGNSVSVFFPTLQHRGVAANSPIEYVKSLLPLTSYLSRFQPIRQNDRYYMSFCPGHNDQNQRSLSIDTQAGLCSCFNPSCKLCNPRGFDVVGVHAALNGLNNFEAALDLMRRMNER